MKTDIDGAAQNPAPFNMDERNAGILAQIRANPDLAESLNTLLTRARIEVVTQDSTLHSFRSFKSTLMCVWAALAPDYAGVRGAAVAYAPHMVYSEYFQF